LAKTYPSLKCVVQDFPALEAEFNAAVPHDLKSRVTFHGYDFFTPQPIKGADVYFFRHVLHDWSDTYAIKILQNTVLAMKNGSRVIAMELVQPPPGSVPRFVERIGTSMDLQMMGALNSKERTREDWIELFKRADPRLSVKDFVTPPGAATSVIEVVFCE
jgi:6-hydroxytryprostatin B O-methyltransferase